MAVVGGQILHDAEGFVLDRVQNAGPGQLNIPQEKIYELGNDETVATVYDIPELTFDLESYDVSTEMEALLLGIDPTTVSDGDEFDFANHIPLDVISPYKSRKNAYNVVKGIITPYLTLERVTYRFGVRQNSTQQFSLRGDSIYYTPGQPFYQEETYSSGTPSQSFTFDNGPATVFTEDGASVYALCVTLTNPSTGAFKRLFLNDHYINSNTGFTVTAGHTGYTKIKFVYGAAGGQVDYNQAVHQGVGVKPAAVRGKNIDVYLSNGAATPVLTRFDGVQTCEVSRSVNLEKDEELGNAHYVSQDYVTADVTGSLGVKPLDPQAFFDKVATITNVDSSEIIGAQVTEPVEMEIRISHPTSGDVLKTIYVPEARFSVPGVSGRANQKLETTFSFTSDTGRMLVYAGERP